MRHQLRAEQWVPYPVEMVFRFFANPENLPGLMPLWQQVRTEKKQLLAPPSVPEGAADGGPETKAAGAGSRFTISFRPFPFSPFRVRWEAVIVEFEWDNHFCDEQGRGPFAYWRHCHRVTAQVRERRAGTLIADDLIYELPFGLLGDVAHKLVFGGQVRSLFRYRQARLERKLDELAALQDRRSGTASAAE